MLAVSTPSPHPSSASSFQRLWPFALLLAPFLFAFFFGLPLLLFATLALAGFGITGFSALALRFEERLVFGALLGSVAFGAASFCFSLLARDVTPLTVGGGLAVTLLLGAVAAWRARTELLSDAASFSNRWRSLWPLGLLTLAASTWIWHFFAQAYTYLPSGLYAGYINIWGDWAAHLTFTSSFAYGHNFPPQFSIDPGNHLGYPFMIDFFAATLIPLGVSLTSSLVLTSSFLALLLTPLFYLVAARFTQSRLAGVLAPLIFLLSGGLGFTYLIPSIDASGFSVLLHLPREYTLNRALNYQWLNPVLAYLVPQRSTLFGFSLFLLILALFYQALRTHAGMVAFLFLGIVAGLTPAFHVHAYASAVAVCAIWGLFNWRKQLLAFFVPALLLGLPVLAWMWPPAQNLSCSLSFTVLGHCFEPGWLSFADWSRDGIRWFAPDFIWFWIKNTSVFLPLIIAAHYAPRLISHALLKWFAPLWLWFAVPNLFILQPWDWDNTKFFIFFFLFGSIFVALLLANFFRHSAPAAALATACLVLLVFSGALDISRASNFALSSNQFIDSNGLKLATFIRASTPADATFVVAPDHNSPVPTLTGRPILVGYPGWLWTYGLSDYNQKLLDDDSILQGKPSAAALIARYHVSYVLIGPQETASPHSASTAYWSLHGTVVYQDGEYTLYHVG